MQNQIDKRMLKLIELLKTYGEIRFEKEFCDAVGILPQNINNVRKGVTHFTTEHLHNAVIHYRLNANWMFGTEKELFLELNKRLHISSKTY